MSKEKEKVPDLALFTMDNFPGVKTALNNIKNNVENTKYKVVVHTFKNEDITKVHKDFFGAEKVILGGWHPTFYEKLLTRKSNVYILFCSSILQMEMSIVEMTYIRKIVLLNRAKKIKGVIVGSKYLYEYLDGQGNEVELIPYPINFVEYNQFKLTPKTNKNDIGLFLPEFHARKNVLNQYFALIQLDRIIKRHNEQGEDDKIQKITVHSNVDIIKDSAELEMEVINNGWLKRKQYMNKIENMKLGLHVTIAESFGYGAFDYLINGVPVLISPVIASNFNLDEELSMLIIYNTDSTDEIIAKAIHILTMSAVDYNQLAMVCRTFAKAFLDKRNALFLKWFNQFMLYKN